MKFSKMQFEHYSVLAVAVAIGAVGAWQASVGHPLVVGGVAVLGVLTTLKALLTQAPQ